MTSLVMRNLRLYFRDKTAVFFSLLGVIIIIALYLLFLGDVWAIGYEGLAGIKPLMGSWIMSGVIAVAGVTSAMGALGVMVDDRTRGSFRDFSAAPLRRTSLVGGYVISTYIVSVIMSLVAFVLGEVYIIAEGGAMPGLVTIAQVVGIILLNSLASSAFVFLIVNAFRSSSAYGAASTVLGTLSGFLMGIYLPVGQLPEAVQLVIKIFPMSHSGVLLRQVMMKDAMAMTFHSVPEPFVTEFRMLMGVDYAGMGTWAHIAVIVGAGLLFAAVSVALVSKKQKIAK